MKNKIFRKIVALALVWCLIVGGMPTVVFPDGYASSSDVPISVEGPQDDFDIGEFTYSITASSTDDWIGSIAVSSSGHYSTKENVILGTVTLTASDGTEEELYDIKFAPDSDCMGEYSDTTTVDSKNFGTVTFTLTRSTMASAHNYEGTTCTNLGCNNVRYITVTADPVSIKIGELLEKKDISYTATASDTNEEFTDGDIVWTSNPWVTETEELTYEFKPDSSNYESVNFTVQVNAYKEDLQGLKCEPDAFGGYKFTWDGYWTDAYPSNQNYKYSLTVDGEEEDSDSLRGDITSYTLSRADIISYGGGTYVFTVTPYYQEVPAGNPTSVSLEIAVITVNTFSGSKKVLESSTNALTYLSQGYSNCGGWTLTRNGSTTAVTADTTVQNGDVYNARWSLDGTDLYIIGACTADELPPHDSYSFMGGSVVLPLIINGQSETRTLSRDYYQIQEVIGNPVYLKGATEALGVFAYPELRPDVEYVTGHKITYSTSDDGYVSPVTVQEYYLCGSTVQLRVAGVSKGKKLTSLSLTSNNKEVDYTGPDESGYYYSFVMPAGDVAIESTFGTTDSITCAAAQYGVISTDKTPPLRAKSLR